VLEAEQPSSLLITIDQQATQEALIDKDNWTNNPAQAMQVDDLGSMQSETRQSEMIVRIINIMCY
jgi:hypothetical protein